MKMKMKNKLILLLVFIMSTASALTIQLERVKVQYVNEADRIITTFDLGEIVTVTNNFSVYVGDGVTAGGILIGKFVSDTAPGSPAGGDIWMDDTISTAVVMKVYNGTVWKIVTFTP